ncbi:MAG: AraC family transcriptional regulator [Clostridia bacterium]|nr:AraC family transcriptional regulator [Clostridia bacterium]
MFKEELSYDDRSPICIRIVEMKEYPLHYHADVEFIFVLKGEVRLLSGSNNYLLGQNSFFVCNGKEVHGMYATEKENVIALVQVNNRIFSKYYPNLSRSCYRTYTEDLKDNRLEFLRSEIIKLLYNHMKKVPHYQETNVAIIKKVLAYLEANFNYFSIENNIVINRPIESFTMSKRVSRIILNVYENYYKRLTLEELSVRERLSEYYLSHVIHDYIGISFRDFLSFARVESSQLMVLDESINIREIHAITGFSGRQYFEKHFKRWFGQTPMEYRTKFIRERKSFNKQEAFLELDEIHSLNLLEQYESSTAFPNERNLVSKQNILHVYVDAVSGKSIPFHPEISIGMSKENKNSLETVGKLQNLNPHKIISMEKNTVQGLYGLDTIAGAVYILRNLQADSICLPFIDSPTGLEIFRGSNSIMFSNGLTKCSYYALLFLAKAKGELIDRGENYWIIKKASQEDMPSFIIIVFNGNKTTDLICSTHQPKEKTMEAISSFNEEINIKFSLKGLFGPYKVATVTLNSTTDYYYYLNNHGNRSTDMDIENLLAEQYTLPYVSIHNTDSVGSLETTTRLDGLCVQMISIAPLHV